MLHSIIQKSQLEGALRIDAEYYQSEYTLLLDKLIRNDIISIDEMSEKVTQGPNPTFLSEGKDCLNGRNIKSYRVDALDSNYVSEEEFKRFQAFKVKPGDILITLKGLGSIGKIGYVFEDIDAIFSRDVGLIRTKENSESLFAFLLSKYGIAQIERSSTGGTGQRTLTTNYIKQFKIPKFNSEIIRALKALVNNSELEYQNSRSCYKQAEDLLLKELGLVGFKSDEDLWSIVNFSDVQDANRIDPEYFQLKYQKLIAKLKNQHAKPFLEVIENISAGFNSHSKPDEQFKYVELSNINTSIGTIDGFSEVLGKEAPTRAKRILKVGDVIVSSIEGSLGKVALVKAEQENYLASTGFFQFKSKEILPEVLLVLAKSIVLQMQFQKHCAGTILSAVPNDALKQMYVPVLEEEIQKKIADLVKKSHETRKKSEELLMQAKKKVEDMIEKGT